MNCNWLESFLEVNTKVVKLEWEKRAREKEELVLTRGRTTHAPAIYKEWETLQLLRAKNRLYSIGLMRFVRLREKILIWSDRTYRPPQSEFVAWRIWGHFRCLSHNSTTPHVGRSLPEVWLASILGACCLQQIQGTDRQATSSSSSLGDAEKAWRVPDPLTRLHHRIRLARWSLIIRLWLLRVDVIEIHGLSSLLTRACSPEWSAILGQ